MKNIRRGYKLGIEQHNLLRTILFEYRFLKHWVGMDNQRLMERIQATGRYNEFEKTRLNEVRSHWINYNK